MDKVIKSITGWQFKILSFGGKVTLVKHVLQSIPIHTVASISPPKTTVKYINKSLLIYFGVEIKRRKIINGLTGNIWISQ